MEKRQFFGSMAEKWENSIKPEKAITLRKLLGEIPFRKDSIIIDIGCGTGKLIPFLLENLGREAKIYALDFSEEMIREAKKKFSRENIEFLRAGVENIPIADQTFDFAVTLAAFPHFSDKEKALKEIHRILKPGACFTIIHLDSREEINHFHKRAGGPIGMDMIPGDEEMERLMREAGFQEITIEDGESSYRVVACRGD